MFPIGMLFPGGILTSRPASLTSNDLDLVGVFTGKLLDVIDGLSHVVEVSLVRILSGLTLPVGEGVGEAVHMH